MFGNSIDIIPVSSDKISNFDKQVCSKKLDKPTFVWFYANYCGHCHSMYDDWKKLEKTNGMDKKVTLLKIESDQKSLLSNDPKIYGYPTLRLYKVSGSFVDYNGSRDAVELNTTKNQKKKISKKRKALKKKQSRKKKRK
jgi:thiol-disulfide isomerase/thioredoxin